MRNKLIVFGIILIVAIIPVITLANMKFRQLDSEGRIIVYSSDDMEGLENETKISLAIPLNETNNELQKDNELLMKQKNEDIKQARANGKSKSISQEEKQSLINDLDTFDNSELRNKEDKFRDILRKYYKAEDIDDLFAKIKQEIEENDGVYKVPETSLEMLKLTIDLLKSNKITSEEDDVIRYILEEIDTTFIEDEELLNELKSVNVTLDINE